MSGLRKVVTAWRASGIRNFGIVTDGLHGNHGADGGHGDDGWTPVFAGELDGSRTVMRVADWTGGSGGKPSVGQYIGPIGYVTEKADAFNFNHAKRIDIFSASTNASGIASINYSSMNFTVAPKVVCLPATTSTLSGPTRSTASSITTTGCSVTVQQQALLTGLVAILAGATAYVLVIEQ